MEDRKISFAFFSCMLGILSFGIENLFVLRWLHTKLIPTLLLVDDIIPGCEKVSDIDRLYSAVQKRF